MAKISTILSLLIFTSGAWATLPYGTIATPISNSHEYLQKNPAPDYWALSPYYIGQSGQGASSVTSMVMILNYARAHLPISTPLVIPSPNGSGSPMPSGSPVTFDEEMINQDVLLRKAADGDWSRTVGNPGSSLTLDQLAHVVEQACHNFGYTSAKATPFHAQRSDTFRKTMHNALVENEKSSNDFIIADFNESSYVGEIEIDHVAPVAAFDASKKRILILDPDRTWVEPYWVSEETFLDGMATADKVTGMARGFVWIKLR